MHFATQQRQQHTKHKKQEQKATSSSSNSSLTSIATTSATGTSSATRFVALCKSSSQGALPKSLATAQNYLGSLRKTSFSAKHRHKRAGSLSSAPMIKDIEITTTIETSTATSTGATSAMICDAQQEQQLEEQQHEAERQEKARSSNGDRRDSLTEEITTSAGNNKLLTIQETNTFDQANSIRFTSSIGTQNVSPPVVNAIVSDSPQTLPASPCLDVQGNELEASSCSTNNSSITNATSSVFQIVPSDHSTPSINIIATDEYDTVPQEEQPLQSQSVDSNEVQTLADSYNTDNPVSRKSSTGSKDSQSKLSEAIFTDNSTQHFVRGTSIQSDNSQQVSSSSTFNEKHTKGTSRLSERAKKKSWYNVIYPNYKSRAEDFKKLFKEVPNDERLIVDYSCALQRDILVQGRLYVSQNYVCFHANIFSWETYVSIKWKDVTAITKEKTALVIPNAISISTAKEKFFFATFAARDKSFLMLFRVWQNTLMNTLLSPQEVWKYVHKCYGEELGLTTDDEDYIDPTLDADTETDADFQTAAEELGEQSNSSQSTSQPQQHQSGNSSASSGGTNTAARKSKTKYFFTSSKSSNINSSANASASGSDNKTSGDGTRKSNKKMKANAKELTLSSVRPADQLVSVSVGLALSSNTASSTSGEHKKHFEIGSMSSSASQVIDSKNTIDSKRKVTKNQRQRDMESAGKNAEAVPTDVSDSSDSEENNIPFVATTECTSTHEGRQIVHTILPINVDTLFNLLFSKSKFLTDFHSMRKSTDLSMGEWSTNEDGQNVRIVNVTVQLAASVGPKASKVTEHQIMRDCTKPGELYSIDVNSVNAGIPYADSFSVLIHFCLARTVDDHTMLSVHAQIKYKKSIWGVVKGFIEKNTWAGLEDFFGAQLHALQSETCIPPAKGKGRRPRRGTAAQIRPMEETTCGTAQAKHDTVESQFLSTGTATAASGGHSTNASCSSASQQLATQQQNILHGLPAVHGQQKFKHKSISVFVILLMCLLLALNVILLLKLWKLEERIDMDLNRRARVPNLASLKELPNTNQDWLELLRQQELSHESELRKWHQVLQTAIELLKKTEKTLAEVMFR